MEGEVEAGTCYLLRTAESAKLFELYNRLRKGGAFAGGVRKERPNSGIGFGTLTSLADDVRLDEVQVQPRRSS